MKKRKITKMMMAAMLAVLIMVQSFVGIPVYATESSSAEMDLSLTTEIAQAQVILNQFMRVRNGDVVFDNPQEVAAEYIPEGSWCTDVSRLGDVLYIDYRIDNVRYIVGYYSDGTVEKVVRDLESDNIYSVYSNTNVVECMNLQEHRQELSISEEEATRRMEQMQEEQWDVNSCYALENSLVRASGKVVDPLSYTSVSSTAPYNAKIVLSGNVTISAFSGTNYSTLQAFRVYETMAYHSEVTKKTQVFAVGATIAKIASAFVVPTNTAKTWLTAAGVLFNTSNILQESCQVIDEHAYTYLGGKECGNYDPTVSNAYVETYTTWSQGKITLTWQYNSATGYNNPSWGHSVRSTSLQVGNTTVRDSGRDIYNNNIVMHGQWNWGVGNGFGY